MRNAGQALKVTEGSASRAALPENADNHKWSIVELDKFIQATRDSGYRGTTGAISELVDNSIQAGATRVAISITNPSDSENAVEVSVLDNGCGMSSIVLRKALRFGGSTRFGNRAGLGRYGMGLPNASLSQARRVTVYTWQSDAKHAGMRSRPGKQVYVSYLDIDAILHRQMTDVPEPLALESPPTICSARSGTLVVWSACDRLDHRRISTLIRKLEPELGRRFRHYLWRKIRITINGNAVRPFDPLYLHPKAAFTGARCFGELRCEVRADAADPAATGLVRVRFSELPVHKWHKFSNEEKRMFGISKGAGVSIIRADREVDYGWFFMGSKRRENYDDWWRCEIQFDPILDEAFGITHTKQQIRPRGHLLEALTPDIEATARALNSRIRKAHLALKPTLKRSEAERIASERDHLLPPLPKDRNHRVAEVMKKLKKNYRVLLRSSNKRDLGYLIVESAMKDMSFYSFSYNAKKMVLILNRNHPFYRDIYQPLAEGEGRRDKQLRTKLELLLLAAARSELAIPKREGSRHRLEWSNTLATYLND